MKYVLFSLAFLSFFCVYSVTQANSNMRQLDCFRPFVQDKFFKDNWKKILAWSKDYKADYKKFGIQRFFIRPHEGDLSHLPIAEKWGGLLFKESNYKNAKWYFELERVTFQYIPRKLSKLVYKTPYEFSVLRAGLNKLNGNLSPHGWRLTAPVSFSASIPPLIFFWGGAYTGVEALGDLIHDIVEKKEMLELIQNDFRYQQIKTMLDDEIYDEELAILKAMELKGVYNLYFDTIKEYLEEGFDMSDPELSKFFLSSEDMMAIFSPIFNRAYGYSSSSFWQSTKIEYLKEKGVDFSKMHKLMLIAQRLVITHVRLESYLHDLANGLKTQKYKMDSYLEDEFVMKILELRHQNIPFSKIKYWLMKDLDNQARMDEYDVLGVRYRLPEDLGEGYFNMDIFREEILHDVEDAMK